MKVDNVNIFGLEESVRGAKFPMSVDTEKIISAEELRYWLADDFLARLIKHMESGEYPKYNITDACVEMTLRKKNGDETVILIDEEDLPSVFNYKWNFCEYCKSMDAGLLHRFIMQEYLRGDDEAVVDHINHDTRDNRKCNLRLASRSNNSYNAVTRRNNRSGIMGVFGKLTDASGKRTSITTASKFILGTMMSLMMLLKHGYKKRQNCAESSLRKDSCFLNMA